MRGGGMDPVDAEFVGLPNDDSRFCADDLRRIPGRCWSGKYDILDSKGTIKRKRKKTTNLSALNGSNGAEAVNATVSPVEAERGAAWESLVICGIPDL